MEADLHAIVSNPTHRPLALPNRLRAPIRFVRDNPSLMLTSNRFYTRHSAA